MVGKPEGTSVDGNCANHLHSPRLRMISRSIPEPLYCSETMARNLQSHFSWRLDSAGRGGLGLPHGASP